MNLFLDISHPAYAHALMPFMHAMQRKGHQLLISARDKDITLALLQQQGFSFFNRGKSAIGMTGNVTLRTR